MEDLIQSTLAPDGVLLATIDMPGRSMNVFSAALMDALEALMDRVDADKNVKSVVLTSGKPSFLAGADLVMVRGYCDAARTATHHAMFELCGHLGRLFVRLEASPKPWVAAVNGIALGGGLELALACRVRIVADDPRIQLGVPEVKLGLLPGAGGTQRLPRLIGFEAAMDLLLSGRAVAPAEAVKLGLFASVVPPAQLMDEARAIARGLHGTAYDAKLKYRMLKQEDVPTFSDETACAVMLKQGISADDFAHYPAYSAITDSVLKGARLPMVDANALEMHQFLRLMFNPVAGRMVRTLFLERLRGERELAPPLGTQLARLRHGRISGERALWATAVGKLKVPVSVDNQLPADTLVLEDSLGASHPVLLRVLDDAPEAVPANVSLAVLTAAGPHGRVLEFIAGNEAAGSALALLATRLWCLPWRTRGPASVLQRLRGQTLANQAQTVLRIAADGARQPASSADFANANTFAGADDLAFYDVGACLAGLTPAWSGGPLTWLWTEQAGKRAGFDTGTEAAWQLLEPALRQYCAQSRT